MQGFDIEIYKNDFKDKKDIQKFLADLLTPLKDTMVRNHTRLHLSNQSTGAPDDVSQMEGFSRLLWGLAALEPWDKEAPLWEAVRQGIICGTNPDHPDYFGDLKDYDQRLVEMGAISYTLVLRPECLYEPLNQEQKDRLISWLEQANKQEAYACNWKFFRVMVNIAFKSLGLPYNQVAMDAHLEAIEDYYVGDGWYQDGILGQAHADYYVPFALHYYGLFYAMHMADVDPLRAKLYRQRAEVFAEDFIDWFAEDGAALPYGRSLAYRFAQGAFWSMMVVSGAKLPMTLGELKGLMLRHLRWWHQWPIYDRDGYLTIGYTYPNSFMTENYIAPGSVYWALKTCVFALLPSEHPFWSVPEAPMPKRPDTSLHCHAGLVIKRRQDSNHLLAYNVGNTHTNGHIHVECKYEKFVYSTLFGFSVPRSHKTLEFGAYDCTLAVALDGQYYRHKDRSIATEMDSKIIKTIWSPFEGVTITTKIIMGHPHHERIHTIDTKHQLHVADGGFAINVQSPKAISLELKEDRVVINNGSQYSMIRSMTPHLMPVCIYPPANTNLYHARTMIPTLKGIIEPGITTLHTYVSADYNLGAFF